VDSAEPGVRDEIFSQATKNIMGQTERKCKLNLRNSSAPM